MQSHIDLAYLILKGDVSEGNLPSTLYLVDDKTFASPIPAARKLPSQPAVKAFDQFYYLGINTVSAWALDTSEGIILFGTLNNTDEATQYIEGGLRRVGLDPAKIKYIVITHGHGDHTGLNTVKEPSKGGGKILRGSLEKFAKVSVAAGADVVVSSHPFLDDAWVKAKLVNEGKAGKTSPWVADKDAVLRYYAATIEAVYAIEAYDRSKGEQH